MSSKISVSTWSLQQATYTQGMTIDEMIETVASMNVDGFDFYGEYIPCYPDVNLYELDRIVKKCEANKLPIISTWFMCDIPAAIKASSLERVLDETRRYIALTAHCGAKFITYPFLFNVPDMTMEQHYETHLRFFEKLLPTCEEYNVTFAHECAREHGPRMALRLREALDNKYYTVCPDIEAWRIGTPDLPLVHAERPEDEETQPESLDLFRECLPYAPLIHMKLLSLNEEGEEPHFPIAELMQAINESPILHHLDIEYEGWIPDIHPDRDCVAETRRCVDLLRRYQKN